ncbi:MAG: glycosyl transferase, partial [Pseudomonadota bacterium]
MNRQILQSLIWPELGLNQALFMHKSGNSRALQTGERVDFDAYMNLFPLGKWALEAGLSDLSLRLCGSGAAEVEILCHAPGRAPQQLLCEPLLLSASGTRLTIPLPGIVPRGATLTLALRALAPVTLKAGHWETTQTPRRPVRLAVVMTTYRREEAARASAARFADWAETTRLPVHLIVVDNGRSLSLPPSRHVTILSNANLGGAGGFARGLMAARDRGFSHCLFMDDDASSPMEAIARTRAFLSFVRDCNTAIAGAMISTDAPDEIWENGATFHCFPTQLAHGTDLRDGQAVRAMEAASHAPLPAHAYGGWWFFAFP